MFSAHVIYTCVVAIKTSAESVHITVVETLFSVLCTVATVVVTRVPLEVGDRWTSVDPSSVITIVGVVVLQMSGKLLFLIPKLAELVASRFTFDW